MGDEVNVKPRWWDGLITTEDMKALVNEIDRLERERDAWREIAIARGKLLICYRTGTQRGADAALKRIEKATKVLGAFGIGIDGELQ